MLRLKGLECLVSILKCMVEWSRDYYIDPATTGLNTVRVIRAEKGSVPEQLGLNEGDGEEREVEEKAQSRHSSLTVGRSGTGTGAEGGHLYSYILTLHAHVPYNGYFSGGKIFVVFMVERQTMNYFSHETALHSTGVWFTIPRPRKFFHELAKN